MSAYASRKIALRISVTICMAMALFSLGIGAVAESAPAPASAALEPGDLGAFGQLAPGQGWLLLGGRLFFTDDGGADWRDITPGETTVESVAFLDAAHGWVLLADPSGNPSLYTLAFTPDAGLSWQTSALDLPELAASVNPVAAVFMGWRDGLHGWLVFKLATGSNFSLGLLFVTQDGGATWEPRPIPLGEPASFVSDQVGWVAGGPAGDSLYLTLDGGLTWQAGQVPEAAAGGRRVYYRLPLFENETLGLLPVVTADGESLSADFYRTEDGGVSWTLAGRVPLGSESAPEAGLPLSLLAADRMRLVVSGGAHVAVLDGGQLTVQDNADGASAGIVTLSMSSLDSGWAKWAEGSCTPAGGTSTGLTCLQEVKLLATSDGGLHWTPLPLPGTAQASIRGQTALVGKLPAGEPLEALGALGAATEDYSGQGFDTCEIPTLSRMQTWWNTSPYSAVNLYIGGSARACSNTALTASFLSQLRAQGWRFIPTWVGPQAYCTGYASRMRSDPTGAYNDGIAEGGSALLTARSLGLTPTDMSGTVIYYDLEAYNSGDAACRAAANAFMSGWAYAMHVHNSLAGGYGSACASGISDWATLPNPIDAIWIAAWYGNAGEVSYLPTASVWGIPCVSDSLWPDHQRLHQYAGGHNETWGGTTLNIDSNVLDGYLTVQEGTADVTAPGTPLLLGPAEAALLERSSDTWLSWKTNGDTCSVHVWGGGIDLTGPGNCSLYHLGVRNGGAYSWQVTATNGFGSTLGPVWHFNVRPNPPGTLSVTGIFSTKVSLSWVPSSDGPANVDGYAIYADGVQVGTAASSASSFQVSNLPCVTAHTFYVTALRQGVASAPTNTVAATTTTCAPANLSPVDGTVLLDRRPAFSWDAVPDATGYILQASTSAGFSSLAINQTLVMTGYATTADLAVNTRYYWRVRSTGPFGQGDWSPAISFTTANPPGIPALASPGNNGLVTDYTPRLDWNDVAIPAGTTLDHYQVQVAAEATFTPPLVDANVATSETTLSLELQPNTRYYWRARAYNTLNQASLWSAVWPFRTSITVPEPAAPVNGSTPPNLRPAFDWNDVEGATGYTFQIGRNAAFSSLVTSVTTAASAFTATADLPANVTLFWRVQAAGTNGPSLWSPARSLAMPNPPGIPALASPANGSLTTDYTPRLDWNNAALPAGTTFDHYQVQVSNEAFFAAPVVDETVPGLTASEFAPLADLLANTTYHWRVRSFNSLGQHSTWSAAWNFRTAISPPTLTSPVDGAAPQYLRPPLDWEDVGGATGYRVQVGRDPGFASLAADANVTASAYTPTADLPAGVALYWRALATGPNGPSAWSAARGLSMPGPPGIPVPAAPANGGLTTEPRPRLDWNNVAVPAGTTFEHYQVQVATDSAFAAILLDQDLPGVTASEFAPVDSLTANTIYYWRVRSFNTAGQYSTWSAVWSLRTALLPPLMTSPVDGGAPLSLRPAFDWEVVSGASGYRIQISRTPTFAALVLNVATIDSAYTAAINLPVNVILYWRVQATGANGPSLWSPARSLTTPNPPGIPSLLAPANGSLTTDTTPRLDWSNASVPAGVTFDHYEIQVAAEAAFLAPVFAEDVPGVASSEFTPGTDLLANTRFYWRVRSFNTAGQYSLWSTVRSVRTALPPPALASPADLDAPPALRHSFDWDGVTGAAGYRIQIARYANFTGLVVNLSTTDSAFVLPGDLPANTVLYWRVQATGANGPSLWSPARSLTTPNPPGAPALVLPVNGGLTTDYTPRLDWLEARVPAGTAFDRYQVQAAADAAFSALALDEDVSGLTASEFTPAADLPANTTFYWRVRSFNTEGEYSAWSVVWRFRTAVLQPVLALPANGQVVTGIRPAFDWGDVPGASGYTLQIARDPGFTVLLVGTSVAASGYTPTADLPRGLTIYWRVRANGANGPGLWSAAATFFIQ